MQKKLTIGRTYAVTASTTCDVTDANGALITTAYPGQQIVFVAPTTTVSFTDDAASVVAVFKLALAKTRLFEQLGGGRLPTGYIPSLCLKCNRERYVFTDLQMTGESGIAAVYDYEGKSGVGPPFYACKSGGGLNTRLPNPSRAYADYWDTAYSLPAIKEGKTRGEINLKNDRKITNGSYSVDITNSPTDEDIASGVFVRISQNFTGSLYRFQFSEGSRIIADMLPAIDVQGVVCLYDRIQKKNYYYTAGSGSVPVVALTVAQARKLWQLPADAPNKTLRISLPQSAFVDLETGEIADAAVNAALALAEAKGWVITKQYYTE